MAWTSTNDHQNSLLLRFLATLFAMVGYHAGGQFVFFAQTRALLQGLALTEQSKLSQLFSLRGGGDAAAHLHRHLHRAVLQLLWLAQAKSRRCAPPLDYQPLALPDILPRQACDMLTAQNVAARVPALYRAWDNLEEQAGNLIRWSAERDRETSLFPAFSQIIGEYSLAPCERQTPLARAISGKGQNHPPPARQLPGAAPPPDT